MLKVARCNFAHLRGCLQTKCGRTDSGQRPLLKPHLSNQCSITRKTAPPPGSHFHDDWAKNVTSRKTASPGSHVIQLTGIIFELNSRIKETDVLTKFHENWAKNVTSRVFTCFHYIHIEKNAPPTGGHVFTLIWTIFELVQDINKTTILTNFHDDWAKIVTSRVFTRKTAPPTGGHDFQRTGTTFELNQKIIKTNILTNFELNQDIIRTNLLTKFHEDRTINAASRVFTNKRGRTTDGRRTDDGQRPQSVKLSLLPVQSRLYGDYAVRNIPPAFDTIQIGERLFTNEAITIFRVLRLKVAG
ncbi:hypothetical protein DPMN_128406 [Dreissena polymorpha]|uniref:Uncharacterized protein n=1 Tax=Dreissena polymorpha TaxID=45954 RepID=A0A9D4H2X9_DREPO|nr:hypothetical protein DPMN_128406 [Dreissena polymorpha]